MVVDGTPVEHHPDLGLWVKREDLCCPAGPHFSKTRGVFAHVRGRNEEVIGVLDTHHSQGGWAVARACHLLGKRCANFFPVRKAGNKTKTGMMPQQDESHRLGSFMFPMPAGRSAVLYHGARKKLAEMWPGATTYMMPNALKLPEMVEETAHEVVRTFGDVFGMDLQEVNTVLVPASSATIAAGVLTGLLRVHWEGTFLVHLGYSRSAPAVQAYVEGLVGHGINALERDGIRLRIRDEGYSYGDEARPGPLPPFPSNVFYDLKTFRWWMREGRAQYGEALLWNIG